MEAVIEHLDQLRRAGYQTGPEDPLVPNVCGGRVSRQRIGEILREAAQAASAKRVAMGLPPLPAVTPHSMRRTYISLALVADNFDVKWVMRQVGHANSKMTLDVYAQLEQRIKRDHGASLDRLISAARTRRDDARPRSLTRLSWKWCRRALRQIQMTRSTEGCRVWVTRRDARHQPGCCAGDGCSCVGAPSDTGFLIDARGSR